ncbi:MAG: methyltransferase domain-containing protein [Burkholderia sp.]
MRRDAASPPADIWSDWLLHIRHADDPAQASRLAADLVRYADHVLDGAQLAPGMTLADIGTGDGLVGLRAVERVGTSLQLVLTDISEPLLRHAEARFAERGLRERCRFVEGSAERLDGIASASVDAVTMRAVLAYVADKPAALRECLRILKPGGRLSIAEPILRDEAIEASALRAVVDTLPDIEGDNFLHLLHRWKAAQFPDTEAGIAASPITNYGERDLVRFALDAGFANVHMAFHIDVQPASVTSWAVLLGTSPHPWAPTLSAVLAAQFTPNEQRFFEQILRPQVEAGRMVSAERVAYLTARKPGG